MDKIALCNINCVDIENAIIFPEQTIEVFNGHITRICDAKVYHSSKVIKTYDYSGCWAIPGITDMHVHITMSPYLNEPDYYTSPQKIIDLSFSNLIALRKIGVTTCRDMGSFSHSSEWVKYVLKKEKSLPYVLTCGDVITYPQGHMCEFGKEIRDAYDIDKCVKANYDCGANFIKVTSDPMDCEAKNRVPNPAFDFEYLDRIVKQSALYGMQVACHTYPSAEGVMRALRSGARTVEHAVPFDSLMDKNTFPDTFYVPTFVTAVDVCGLKSFKETNAIPNEMLLEELDKFKEPACMYSGPIPASIAEWFNILIKTLPKAINNNQLICTGSDAGCKGTEFSSLIREMVLLHLLGATNQQVLQFAITNPCKALHLKHRGKIAVGNIADIIVLKENPLTNIATLLNNEAVICKGELVSQN